MKQDCITVEGIVTSELSNGFFEVKLFDKDGEISDLSHTIRATLSGRVRSNFVRINVNDHVSCQMSPYDLTLGRITFRHPVKSNDSQAPVKRKDFKGGRKKK